MQAGGEVTIDAELWGSCGAQYRGDRGNDGSHRQRERYYPEQATPETPTMVKGLVHTYSVVGSELAMCLRHHGQYSMGW